MNWADITALIGALGGAGGVLALLDGYRKRKRIPIDQSSVIANNAVSLIKTLQTQADMLQRQLNSANTRADDLQDKHDTLLIQLSDAQYQMRNMRVTINTLTEALDKRGS